MNCNNKHFKIIEKEYGGNFNDHSDKDEEETGKFINNNLSKLPYHQLIKRINLDELLWDVDAVSLYPSATWDENSIYLKIESGYAYTKVMNDELVEKINNQTFTQGSAILKIKYYNP